MPTLGMSGAIPTLPLYRSSAHRHSHCDVLATFQCLTLLRSPTVSNSKNANIGTNSGYYFWALTSHTHFRLSTSHCHFVFPQTVQIRPKHAALPMNHITPTNNCALGRCFNDSTYSCTILHRYIMWPRSHQGHV
jgi:hypothetical protein